MQAYIRFIALVSAMLWCTFAHGDSNSISIFFDNKTRSDFTIKPSNANFCIDEHDEDLFTVAAGSTRTYYATLHQNCTDANLTFDYSQTINAVSAESSRTINGTLTYAQFTQYGTWKAKLKIELTPPVPTPRPVVFRSTCGADSLFCASDPVAVATNNFRATFTVIPELSSITWGFAGLTH